MATASASINVDAADLLTGRNGLVSNVMAGFAGLVTTAVKDVASERLATSTPGGYRDQITSTWDGTRIVTTAAAPYSAVIESGSRPHTITPRDPDGVLRFEVGGQVVYTRIVQHPGTRAYHVVRDGTARAGRERFGG